MIPEPFDYYQPDTMQEAENVFQVLSAKGICPAFYGGGSEIITMARSGSIKVHAVIDLKAIPECKVLGFYGQKLVVGSAVTLSQIAESKLFPLLEKTCGRISDHTNQCRITIGGNVCGTIIYRESVLPLLLSDCDVVLFGKNGIRQVKISEVFDRRMKLNSGELIVQFIIGREFINAPFIHVKKTKNEKIDYPLLTLAAMKHLDKIRMAFSGLCKFPFRSTVIEDLINNTNSEIKTRIENAALQMPDLVLNNVDGSDQYRLFVFKNTIENVIEQLGGR
ncbi:MAG: FAD binding domain-containing protein [Clostridiales bacterium]|nr:FAD binding domain-containing protein [Clostridiales bacterium]